MMQSVADDFFKAITAGNDDLTEALAHSLTALDEAALQAAIEKGDLDQQWWAVRGLALIGGEAAIQTAAALLQNKEAQLRTASLMALAALHNRHPTAVLPQIAAMAARLADEDGMVRQAASDALAQCGNDAVPMLGEVLRGEHQGARTRAAQALRQIATMPAAAVLYRCLNDSNYMVHTYAYEGLDEMGLLETMLLVV